MRNDVSEGNSHYTQSLHHSSSVDNACTVKFAIENALGRCIIPIFRSVFLAVLDLSFRLCMSPRFRMLTEAASSLSAYQALYNISFLGYSK